MKRRIITSFAHAQSLPIQQRVRYYIPAQIREALPIQDNNEPLIWQAGIEQAGIICRPFWQDPPTNETVDEGAAFRTYLRHHPGFSLSVRGGVLPRLQQAQRHLPRGWHLVLRAGYRPPEVQKTLFKAMLRLAQQQHPTWRKQQLLEYTRQFVADPTLNAPAHTTGGAVDVMVVDLQGNEVDMGTPINTDGDAAMTFYTGISQQAQQHRRQLLQVMIKAGFANLVDEWWHFSYGDPTWAVFYGRAYTPYAMIDKPA